VDTKKASIIIIFGGVHMGKKRRKFTKAFKEEAVRLIVEEGRRVSELSRELGVGVKFAGPLEKEIRGRQDRAIPRQGPFESRGRRVAAFKAGVKGGGQNGSSLFPQGGL